MLQASFNEVLEFVDDPKILSLYIGPKFLKPAIQARNLVTPPPSLNSQSETSTGTTMSAKQPTSAPAGDRAPSAVRPSSQVRPRVTSQPVQRDDLSTCRYCQRRFASDRLHIHEDICSRTAKKRRKAYDSTKHRIAGTEFEPFAKKGGLKSSGRRASTAAKSNWRQRHEEFIGAIRAAKEVQQHIAKGGNIKDLPPPAPSVNPDYVQCPHCGRRFNQAAAERHIPKCATYEFNKPKK